MTVLITLTLGTNTGPFNIYDDTDGYTTAIETAVPRQDLIDGYTTSNVTSGATGIKLEDTGACASETLIAIDLLPPPITYDVTVMTVIDYNAGFTEQWSNITSSLAGTNTSDGEANTASIIAQAGHTVSHALTCSNLNYNGFTDWFLPAYDTLIKMYPLKATLDAASIANGGTALINTYTCSTEDGSGHAWSLNVNNGFVIGREKPGKYPYRPCRHHQTTTPPSIGDFIGGGVVISIN